MPFNSVSNLMISFYNSPYIFYSIREFCTKVSSRNLIFVNPLVAFTAVPWPAGMFNHLVNLFYPRLCCGCSLPLQRGETAFCITCRLDLPRTGFFTWPQNPVHRMFTGRFSFHRAGALYLFEKGNIVQHALHQLKYKGHREAGEMMGMELGIALTEAGWMGEITHLVPVPLHPRKQAIRGYNQTEVIATAVSQCTHIPVNQRCIERAVFSETQTRQKKYSRWNSVQDIFKSGKEKIPPNSHVLLIDDVVTTGSTVEACARVLNENENIKISLAVLAYAAVK
jgi:ComF family protein